MPNKIVIDGITYNRAMGLIGRGQDTPASFYSVGEEEERNSKQYLIKHEVDTPAIALLEGSGKYIWELLPEGQRDCVILPEVVEITNSRQVETSRKWFGTKQEKLVVDDHEVRGWDQVILQRKRNPKAWSLSDEHAKFSKAIHANINEMSPKAKRSLAAAIFASSILGDESMHIGQYMAVIKDNEIDKIVRIDLGARARFMVARLQERGKLKSHQTSMFYSGKLQSGKEYQTILLKNTELKRYYLHYWLRAPKAKAETYQKELEEGFEKISDPRLRTKALMDMSKIVFKDCYKRKGVVRLQRMIRRYALVNKDKDTDRLLNFDYLTTQLSQVGLSTGTIEDRKAFNQHIRAVLSPIYEDPELSKQEKCQRLAEGLLIGTMGFVYQKSYELQKKTARRLVVEECNEPLIALGIKYTESWSWLLGEKATAANFKTCVKAIEEVIKKGATSISDLKHGQILLGHIKTSLYIENDNEPLDELDNLIGQIETLEVNTKALLLLKKYQKHLLGHFSKDDTTLQETKNLTLKAQKYRAVYNAIQSISNGTSLNDAISEDFKKTICKYRGKGYFFKGSVTGEKVIHELQALVNDHSSLIQTDTEIRENVSQNH